MKKVAVIFCAAGQSARFGQSRKKPFIEVGGRAAFLRSIEFFAARSDVKQMILAIPPDDDELVRIKWGAALSFNRVKICHGGSERFETVAKALKLIANDIDLIAIHDAIRCCLLDEWVDGVITKASQTRAAILACPLIPTLKEVRNGKIVRTIDRRDLYEAQTPQVFDAKLLRQAYARLETMTPQEKTAISDDAALVERLGTEITVIPTDNSNIKITHRIDVAIAQAIIEARPKPKPAGPTGPFIEAQW